MLRASGVLAHAGGAPEAVTLGLPVAIFVGFMLLERRARRRDKADERDEPGGQGGS